MNEGGRSGWRVVAALAVLFTVSIPPAAPAQPMRAPAPTPSPAPGGPTGDDSVFWNPAAARCRFVDAGAGFLPDDPATWRFRFVVMRAGGPVSDGDEPAERGYLMSGGLLREMERVRSGPDAAGREVTVWRSAGEPRINVNMALQSVSAPDGRATLRGTLTLIRGDGESDLAVEGGCDP